MSAAGVITEGFVWPAVASIAWLIWLVGIAVIATRLLLACRYLNRLRSSAAALDAQSLPQIRQMSEEVLRAVAAKRLPPLLVSDQLKGPISLGLFRPAIILPLEMVRALNASQLRDVLIHEMAHIHRHDHVVVLLQRLTGAIFWPFPLVLRLNAKIDEAREDVCDNYVLRHTDASQYSRMLLELTERAAPPQAIPLAIGLWECRRKLEQRVAALLDPRRTTRTRLPRRTLCTLTVAFMSIAVLLAGSRITPTSDAQAAESQRPAGEEAKQPANEEEMKDVARETKPVAVPDKNQTDPYDELYDVLMTRWKDGKSYAQNETSPAIFSWSEFPFDDTTFEKFNAAMDAFAALPQEKIEAYSDVKRALLQRHLWKVFDTTFNWDWWKGEWYWGGRKVFPKPHLERRTALQPKIASLIRRLALTKEQILALPNPLAATVKSGHFAQAHDPADRFKPFLPADLYAEETTWICLGEDGKEIPASQHTSKLYSRSMFLQFIRLPEGRTETLEYMERIRKQPHQFPAGTQFALMEQPFLISKEGQLVLSPLITSIQLRAYLNVGRRFSSSEDDPQITQCVAEFVMQPRDLM
ncbi:MAG: M56 family metallopeptidase [Planctomycetes bacterium]|nr:M56 family metallopeptidase [Planctomycetota bacterium]